MNSSTVYFATSYITDALDDMLKALNALIPELSSYPVSKTQFEWNEEPGGTVWTLSKIVDSLHVQITSFEDLRNKKQQVIELDEKCSIVEFTGAILPKIGGAILIITGVWLMIITQMGLSQMWLNISVLLSLLLVAMIDGLIGPRIKKIMLIASISQGKQKKLPSLFTIGPPVTSQIEGTWQTWQTYADVRYLVDDAPWGDLVRSR
ncbi:hypothetical protein [Paenibacillus guangzhouensis]|uniref:hypothetical protein n=1 Tax=Paenibacillus guangzhouensis TaxID=1473112 RepID=UPI00187B4F10|nr:hypothetical protein [Paenibacillus guangzhouensis]